MSVISHIYWKKPSGKYGYHYSLKGYTTYVLRPPQLAVSSCQQAAADCLRHTPTRQSVSPVIIVISPHLPTLVTPSMQHSSSTILRFADSTTTGRCATERRFILFSWQLSLENVCHSSRLRDLFFFHIVYPLVWPLKINI